MPKRRHYDDIYRQNWWKVEVGGAPRWMLGGAGAFIIVLAGALVAHAMV